MNYREYIERNEKGEAKLPRKQRKTERRNVFVHNRREHSKRTKLERKQAISEAQES